jgi:hypothetical protein
MEIGRHLPKIPPFQLQRTLASAPVIFQYRSGKVSNRIGNHMIQIIAGPESRDNDIRLTPFGKKGLGWFRPYLWFHLHSHSKKILRIQ